jgi:hypothetical protein
MRRLICAFFSFGHTRLDAVYFVSGHFPRVDLWILSLSLLPLWLHLIYELRAHTQSIARDSLIESNIVEIRFLVQLILSSDENIPMNLQ